MAITEKQIRDALKGVKDPELGLDRPALVEIHPQLESEGEVVVPVGLVVKSCLIIQ